MFAPKKIGSYEVLGLLASGGLGAVYLAQRHCPANVRRLVAIKRLHRHVAGDAGIAAMFVDEARLSARIHHANVVSVLEMGSDESGSFVVMDYIEGTDLARLAERAAGLSLPMPAPVVVRVLLDLLAGMHCSHELRTDDGTPVELVHRDVSPPNVLLGYDGVARLTDFGIARAEELRTFETVGGGVKGKLQYMAPEQFEGAAVDRRTDIFSTGTVLWELLTGQALFRSESEVETIHRLRLASVPSPSEVEPGVPFPLSRVCLRALERSPSRRYATAAEFAEDLEQAARASSGIGTQREVAEYVACVMGPPKRPQHQTTDGPAEAAERRPHTIQLPASEPLLRAARRVSPPLLERTGEDPPSELEPLATAAPEVDIEATIPDEATAAALAHAAPGTKAT